MLTRVVPLKRARHRHRRRPGHAGGVQQPLHVDRRADGRDAAEHRLFGQHQGTAGFLLRRVRCRTAPGRQRAAHAGASGLDGPSRCETVIALNKGTSSRATSSCLNAPYNGGTHLPDITVITPVFDNAATRSCSTSPPAATTPMSAARRRARCPACNQYRRGRRADRQLQARRSGPLPREAELASC
jgi:hypothetical protein